jgi:hypothetical protein
MDDKWFSFVEGDRLYMHRSWTTHAVFEAELRPRADDCVDVTNLSRNNDKRQFNMDDRAARDLFDRLLTRPSPTARSSAQHPSARTPRPVTTDIFQWRSTDTFRWRLTAAQPASLALALRRMEFPRFCGVLITCDASVAGRMDWNAEIEAAVPGAVPA